MYVKAVLSVRRYKAGYEVREELVAGNQFDMDDIKVKTAYTPDGHYIGDSKTAYRLCKKRGIKPEPIDSEHNVCSIGFCEKEQKWYGWSHRAIYGFGIGSTCKKGDCHYVPTSFEEIQVDCYAKEEDDCVANCTVALEPVNPDEPERVQRAIPDSEEGRCVCAQENCVFEVGRGEWVAKTLDDAKQMAVDFAKSVA